jgi:hypothetical protein
VHISDEDTGFLHRVPLLRREFSWLHDSNSQPLFLNSLYSSNSLNYTWFSIHRTAATNGITTKATHLGRDELLLVRGSVCWGEAPEMLAVSSGNTACPINMTGWHKRRADLSDVAFVILESCNNDGWA